MYDWDEAKNEVLKRERDLSFEEVVFWIENDGLLGVKGHPNQHKYPGQRIYVVNIEGYVYLVPFVEQDNVIFLKTIIPSRKATKKYLKGASDETSQTN
ncbi:MAG: BrnT family toxin [Nitrospirota bacterium]